MSDSIIRKTLITTGALVGACVAFVGTLTAISLLVASHAVGASADGGAGASAPASTAPVSPAIKPADAKLPRGPRPPTAT
jgi:hypothetical protein